MTKLHRIGFFVCLSLVALVFVIFLVAGIAGGIDFKSSYTWTFIVIPLVLAAIITVLYRKWSIISGSIGVITPFFLCFILEMGTLGRYLFTAVILLYFTGGVLLLIDAIKPRCVNI
jgi:hypothetical protein